MTNCLYNSNSVCTPTFHVPSKLTHLAASAVVKLLVYEDYEDCFFYRWDPVIIWQYETHQPKKKKSKKPAEIGLYAHPPPPWKGIRCLRNWWFGDSGNFLGFQLDSPLRLLLIEALERRSWTSASEEETLLFFFVQICMDTTRHFSKKFIHEVWYSDCSQILENMGPFPLQKMIVDNDIFSGNTTILTSILINAPHLQVLRIGQWEISNELLLLLPRHCPLLCEFSIHDMEPDVFMGQEAFFKCFFKGKGQAEVLAFQSQRSSQVYQDSPGKNDEIQSFDLSFQCLKYVDMVFSVHTEKFLSMLIYFYPNINLSTFCVSHLESVRKEIRHCCRTMPFLHFYGNTMDLKSRSFHNCLRYASSPKEIRLDLNRPFQELDLAAQNEIVYENASVNLKELFREKTSIDSLAIKLHEGVDPTKILLPTFGAYGNTLKCLYFVFDSSGIVVNTLYQLLNLSPLLEKLVLDLDFESKDISSKAFRTDLRELNYLNTLIFLDASKEVKVGDEDDEQLDNGHAQNGLVDDSDEPLAFYTIFNDILLHSPNLKKMSTLITDNFEYYIQEPILSKSANMLQLRFQSKENVAFRLKSLVPAFPNAQTLSLQGEGLWAETLDSLSGSDIRVTRKVLEFTNVFRWDEKRHFFDYNSANDSNSIFWNS